MSNSMYKNMKINDEYYTSANAVEPILKHLKPNSLILCPFDTKDSEYVKVLNDAGHNVIYSHISDGGDFFNYTYDDIKPFDYIISNPPYSIKNEIIERLISFNKPFAMLLGVQSLTIRKFMKLWTNQKLQLILFENKVFFNQPDKGQKKTYSKTGSYFHTYYFCNGWLEKDLYLEVIEKK